MPVRRPRLPHSSFPSSAARALGVTLVVLPVACGDPTGPRAGAERPILFIGRGTAPDGSLGEPAVYAVAADGSGLRRLTTGAGQALYPAWSRDGRQIAFASGADAGTHVWTMAPDGTNARPTAATLPGCVYGFERLTWAPDGDRIAAACFDGTSILDLRTGTAASLSEALGTAVEHPDWSPDGARLLFTQTFSPGIFTAPPDAATAPVRVLPSGLEATWSPDGRRIAFLPVNEAVGGIVVVNADGSGRRQVTTPGGGQSDEGPAWSPDGRALAFHRVTYECAIVPPSGTTPCQTRYAVYAVAADGSGLRRVTPDSLIATRPAW